MNEDNINKFFKEHRQTIKNDGFSERLFSQLDCIPAPAPKIDRSRLIISIFTVVGVVIFIILGGFSALINGLGSMGTLFRGFDSIRPEVVVSVVFILTTLFAAGKFALEEK